MILETDRADIVHYYTWMCYNVYVVYRIEFFRIQMDEEKVWITG